MTSARDDDAPPDGETAIPTGFPQRTWEQQKAIYRKDLTSGHGWGCPLSDGAICAMPNHRCCTEVEDFDLDEARAYLAKLTRRDMIALPPQQLATLNIERCRIFQAGYEDGYLDGFDAGLGIRKGQRPG